MKTIKKTIDIQASKNNVWKVLTEDQYNRQWYAIFSAGTKAKTDWKVGSNVLFVDDSESGLIGKIVSNKPNELLSIEYTGMVFNGKEDYEHKDAKALKGGREIYELLQNGGGTQLIVSGDIPEGMYNSMAAFWDKAMEKLKSLAESIKN